MTTTPAPNSSTDHRSPITDHFKFRTYQLEDLARAAIHDGAILGWEPGLGKTMAIYSLPLLKKARRTFIVAPAALHEQIVKEGREKFGIDVISIPDQKTALDLMRRGILPFPGREEGWDNRVVPEGMPTAEETRFFITDYKWLGYNGCDERNTYPVSEVRRGRRLAILRRLLAIDPADTTALTCARPDYRPRLSDDPWQILGLEPGASPQEIKRAFHTAAKLHHPDLHPDDDKATARFQVINCAHAILTGQPRPDFQGMVEKFNQDAGFNPTRITLDLVDIESGIGETRHYKPANDKPADDKSPTDHCSLLTDHSITCVFRPSLSTLIADCFDCVICDEAVRMKSGTAYQATGVLGMRSEFRYALTGTPIKNKLPDLFFLASWVTGHAPDATARFPYGNDTEARGKFASDFGVMEENLTKSEKAHEKGEYRSFIRTDPTRICNVHRLWRVLGPVVIRRRKDELPDCDIAPRTVVPVRVMPGTAQQRTYQWQLSNPPPHDNKLAALGAQLQCLRQAALFPASPKLHRPGHDPSSACRSPEHWTPKSAGIIQLATDLMAKGEQLVIFSPFTDFSSDLARRFSEAGVPALLLDGSTSPAKRGKQIQRFKSGEFPILIAGITSMGEGHSLECCSNLVLPSLSWAYDENKQAVERVHRLTSRKEVTIYVMVTKNTIDEKLCAVWQDKGDSSDLALDGRLIEEDRQEIDLVQLLRDAVQDFDPAAETLSEQEVTRQWQDTLRPALTTAFAAYRGQRIPTATSTPPPSRPTLPQPTVPPETPKLGNTGTPAPSRPLTVYDLMKQKRQPATKSSSSLITDHPAPRTPAQPAQPASRRAVDPFNILQFPRATPALARHSAASPARKAVALTF